MISGILLQVTQITKKFGNLIAVNKVSFDLHRGEILGLIGPNGAGKTTLFNVLSGMYVPEDGDISFKGRNITGMRPHKICKLGISRTFQVTKAFSHMTVEGAVRVGAYNRKSENEVKEKTEETISFFKLGNIRQWKCEDLGLAQLKRLEIARAVATEPELLLLDEAAAGLTSAELSELMELLKTLRDERHITLCVVEHVMQMVMGLCERIIVLDYGELIARGTPDQISQNERVIEAYLGKRFSR